MTSTPNEVPVATQNDETRMYLRETRTKIKMIEKKMENLDDSQNAIELKKTEQTSSDS